MKLKTLLLVLLFVVLIAGCLGDDGIKRITIKPVKSSGPDLNVTELYDTIDVLYSRLELYGINDSTVIRPTASKDYIKIETTYHDTDFLKDLLTKGGKFEIRVGGNKLLTGDSLELPIGEPTRDVATGAWSVLFSINEGSAIHLRESYLTAVSTGHVRNCTADNECMENFGCLVYTGQELGTCLPEIQIYMDNEEKFAAPATETLLENWAEGETVMHFVVEAPTQEEAEEIKALLDAGQLPERVTKFEVVG